MDGETLAEKGGKIGLYLGLGVEEFKIYLNVSKVTKKKKNSKKTKILFKVIHGTNLPIRVASFVSRALFVKVVFKTKSRREIMLTVICSLCVQSVHFHQPPLYMIKHITRGVVLNIKFIYLI